MTPRQFLFGSLALVLPALAGGTTARAAIIDTWQARQQLSTPPQSGSNLASGPGTIGGFRDSVLFAGGAADVTTLTIGNGTLTFEVDPGASANGFLTVTWAGPTGQGLGGIDVTDGGTAHGFALPVLEAAGGVRYALVVEDTTPLVGNVLGIIPDGGQDRTLFLPFSLFIAQSRPVRIDMSRVEKVQLQFEVPPGGRIVLGPVQTVASVPEPGTVGLWVLAGLVGAGRFRRGGGSKPAA